jgi:hypothetical protein
LAQKKLLSVYCYTSGYFAVGYFFVTFITGFVYARYLMAFSAIFLFSIAYLSNKTTIVDILIQLFILYCQFIVFSLCVFSGGANSPVLAWFAFCPALALLLSANKSAYYNLVLSLVLVVFLYFIDTSTFIPFLQYKINDLAFLNSQLSFGLIGIIFVVVRIFSERNNQLQFSLKESVQALSATEEELKQNNEELVATQNWLSDANEKLQKSATKQLIINNELLENKNLIELKKERQANYINKLSSITKGNFLYSGDLKRALYKLMEESANCLEISRASIWYFNIDKDTITCQVQYDIESKNDIVGVEMKKSDFPIYMESIINANVIIAYDARNYILTSEFNETYFIPNNIYSILDIPLFVDGQNIGVVCFEQTNQIRNWEEEEISFTQSIVDLAAIAIYSSQKKNSLVEIGKQYLQNVDQREKLELLGQQLKMANAYLEEKVKERTRELEEKNIHLAEYTFINVHLLRGPLCRIIGLTNLMALENHDEQTIHILDLLKESNTELEQLIKKITEVLEAGAALNRNDLQ